MSIMSGNCSAERATVHTRPENNFHFGTAWIKDTQESIAHGFEMF